MLCIPFNFWEGNFFGRFEYFLRQKFSHPFVGHRGGAGRPSRSSSGPFVSNHRRAVAGKDIHNDMNLRK